MKSELSRSELRLRSATLVGMSLRAAIFLLLFGLPAAAAAQDDRGVSVGASASATNLESRTSWSFAGSFEYRFNRVARVARLVSLKTKEGIESYRFQQPIHVVERDLPSRRPLRIF